MHRRRCRAPVTGGGAAGPGGGVQLSSELGQVDSVGIVVVRGVRRLLPCARRRRGRARWRRAVRWWRLVRAWWRRSAVRWRRARRRRRVRRRLSAVRRRGHGRLRAGAPVTRVGGAGVGGARAALLPTGAWRWIQRGGPGESRVERRCGHAQARSDCGCCGETFDGHWIRPLSGFGPKMPVGLHYGQVTSNSNGLVIGFGCCGLLMSAPLAAPLIW